MGFRGNKNMLTESFELSKNVICFLYSIVRVLRCKSILNHKINKGPISS